METGPQQLSSNYYAIVKSTLLVAPTSSVILKVKVKALQITP